MIVRGEIEERDSARKEERKEGCDVAIKFLQVPYSCNEIR